MNGMRAILLLCMVVVLLGCSTDNILSYEDQLKKDTAIIDKYLERNNIVALVDASGLRLVVHQTGSGVFPGPDSKLTVKYEGRFMNGQVFDKSSLNSSGLPTPFSSPLSGLIDGWQIAFYKYIAKGGKATLYIPSGLGYGRRETGGVPPNSNLIFDVELISFSNN